MNPMASERTFDELLEAYRKTAIEQSKQTGSTMNDCGMALCGGDILDDLADEIHAAARAEGVEEGMRQANWNMIHLSVREMLDHLYVGYLPEDVCKKAGRMIEGIVATATAQGEAKGRAEGAEQMRQRIVNGAEQGKAEIGHVVEWTEFEGPVFIVPASLLAPDKEGEK